MADGSRMNLRHLRAFLEVCRHGSVTAASADAHLSQPAITQAIAKLESDLGAQLFARSSKGMTATEPGQLFRRRVDRALAMLQAGADRAGRRAGPAPARRFDTVMTSTQLRALIAVAAHRNFSVAARAEGAAQPALYRMARDLEQVTGLPLYLKSVSGIDLTPAAEQLLQAAKLAFAELDQGVEDIRAWRGIGAGRVRIGSMPLSRSAILPAAIDALAARFPEARVCVVDGPYDDLLHGLRHGDIDVIVGALRGHAPAEDVVQEPLFADRLGVFCGAGHRFCGAVPTMDDLAASVWVAPRPGTPTRQHFDDFFLRHGAQPPQRVIETSSTVLMKRLLSTADRLTMISRAQVGADLAGGDLVELAIDLGDSPRRIGLTRRADWEPTALQSGFLDILRDVCGNLPGSGAMPDADGGS